MTLSALLGIFILSVAVVTDIEPIHSPAPELPSHATTQWPELTGHVTIAFHVGAAGQPVKMKVISSNPAKVFDQIVLRALSKWRYHQAHYGKKIEVTMRFSERSGGEGKE